MKKIFLFLLSTFSIYKIHAQENQKGTTQRNDLMLSPIELVAVSLLNISYERLLNENSGVGFNGIFYLGDNSDFDDTVVMQISPYYRMYFGKGFASGFFAEGFVPITQTREYYYYSNSGPYSDLDESNRTTLGIGVGFGGKWVAKKNILFEASIGVARRFGKENYNTSALTGKWMLGIGYRL